MTEYTGRFALEKPNQDDYYDIEVYKRNLEKLNNGAVKGTGVAEIKVMSQSEFNAIESKDDETVYLVASGNDLTLYLGSVSLSNAGGHTLTTAALKITGAVSSTVHTAELKEETE